MGWSILAGVLLGLLVTLGIAFLVARAALDRPAYAGPASDHFDGERFFMPGGADVGNKGFGALLRWQWTRERAAWPSACP